MKYDTKTAVKQLTEIWDSKKKPKEMTKEDFEKAVKTNLPSADNPDVKDFNKFLYPEKPATTPAEGLEKKMKYWKNKDEATQERIKYAQSWNLATQLVSGFVTELDFVENKSKGVVESYIEFWQKYFYLKLGENGDKNG